MTNCYFLLSLPMHVTQWQQKSFISHVSNTYFTKSQQKFYTKSMPNVMPFLLKSAVFFCARCFAFLKHVVFSFQELVLFVFFVFQFSNTLRFTSLCFSRCVVYCVVFSFSLLKGMFKSKNNKLYFLPGEFPGLKLQQFFPSCLHYAISHVYSKY